MCSSGMSVSSFAQCHEGQNQASGENRPGERPPDEPTHRCGEGSLDHFVDNHAPMLYAEDSGVKAP